MTTLSERDPEAQANLGSETEDFALVTEDEPRPPIGGTKRCPYCGGWHSKHDPAVYCSPDHAKRMQRQNAWLARRAKRAVRFYRAERAVANHWRAVIFGDKQPSLPGEPPPAEPGPRRRAGKPRPEPVPLEPDE